MTLVSLSERLLAQNEGGFRLTLLSFSKRLLALNSASSFAYRDPVIKRMHSEDHFSVVHAQ